MITMNQEEFVVFAELKRDHFDEIVQTVSTNFENVEFGRQGDDWIWIHIEEDNIEIDSFYSMELEVKGKYKLSAIAVQLLQSLKPDHILQVFDPPKPDTTR